MRPSSSPSRATSVAETTADDGLRLTDTAASSVKVPESCWPALDALWYCYTPVHQVRHYYMSGQVDACTEQAHRFWVCLRSRLVSADEAVALYRKEAQRERAREGQHAPPVWKERVR